MISLNPDCLLKGKPPAFSLQEKAEIVLHHLAEWGSGYQPDLQFAVYGGDSVKLTTDKALFPLSSELREQLQKAEIVGQHIQLSSERFAKMLSQDLLFWGSEKEISQMGPCTKQNYLLAFDNLNNTLIQPGETFNFNRYLINLKGYCKGMSSNVFLFYGGVCGVSGQLFRAGLSSPQVEIGQRRGHNFRYSKYYGEQVEGDDAAVYERNKQFEFTNTSTQHLLIKTLMKGTKTYLFFITEKAGLSDQRVEIHKVRKSPLEVQIFKTIYQDRDWEKLECRSGLGKLNPLANFTCKQEKKADIIRDQSFHSKYLKVDSGEL